MIENIRLLWDRVLVLPEPEIVSDSVIIPDTVRQEYRRGRITHVGPGKPEKIQIKDKMVYTGNRLPMEVKVGDLIYYGPHLGQPQKIRGVEYVAMNQQDIAAVIDG